MLFAACQQDSLYDDSVIDDQESSVLREMKILINDNYNAVTLFDWERTLKGSGTTRSGGGNRSLKLTKEDFGFDWDNADVITSNLAEAVIIPVKLNKEIALRCVVLEGNFNYPKSPVNRNDTSHVLLDKFYEIIQTVEAEKNENN